MAVVVVVRDVDGEVKAIKAMDYLCSSTSMAEVSVSLHLNVALNEDLQKGQVLVA